jgi:hypothetical protein
MRRRITPRTKTLARSAIVDMVGKGNTRPLLVAFRRADAMLEMYCPNCYQMHYYDGEDSRLDTETSCYERGHFVAVVAPDEELKLSEIYHTTFKRDKRQR